MKSVRSWNDLEPYGIVPMTVEACGLNLRILFDLTEQGQRIIERCLDCGIKPAEARSHGTSGEPHVGSIMLAREMLVPLGIFALLEAGCHEVWMTCDIVIGIESSDSQSELEALCRHYGLMRRFRYHGGSEEAR